tara:strand:+ start:133 stop:351 length:219 start_codon:yes stop_codon:yes gene_type:complete
MKLITIIVTTLFSNITIGQEQLEVNSDGIEGKDYTVVKEYPDYGRPCSYKNPCESFDLHCAYFTDFDNQQDQ